MSEGEGVTKERRLLEMMAGAYSSAKYSKNPEEAWVSMTDIVTKLQMSSFNQRFQEWRKNGIIVEHRYDSNGQSEYMLATNPRWIDWGEFRNKYPFGRPIGISPRRKKIVESPLQRSLFA